MQFQVPQFVEMEDQVFGPFTIKQFIYLVGSGGLVVLINTFVPLWLTFIIGGPIVALGLALAFFKVNNRPFVYIVEAVFNYILGARLYIWKKRDKKPQKIERATEDDEADIDLYVPKLSDSKLKDIAWSLDIQESMYSDPKQR